ncbi:MAG: hypothetical protein R3F61_28855 [Myxococcota bacterium]
MWFVSLALAGLADARPFGPVRTVDVQPTPVLPVPADLLAWDDRVWRLERERVLVSHADGRLDRLPLTDATLWLGPPGYPNLHRRGMPDPVIPLQRQGQDLVWSVLDAKVARRTCGGPLAPYAWSADCRELRFGDTRLTPAKYSRLAVAGGRLWVFGAGQLQVFDGAVRQPRIPGPIVHLAHDDERMYVAVSSGVRALDARTGEVLWSLNPLVSWLAPSPDGTWVALRTEDTLLLLDRDGQRVYALEHLGDCAFAWTPDGDLVGVDATSVVRFRIAEAHTATRGPEARMPEGLVQPGLLELSLVEGPSDVGSLTLDGVRDAGVPARVQVWPVDRTSLDRPADLDIVVHRDGLDETVRVLRPEPGEARPVALTWAPLTVTLEDCPESCVVELGPRLVGSEVHVVRQGTAGDGGPATWERRAVFLGDPWVLAPAR